MTNEEIKALALTCGFKLKEQPNGEMDLNPYVYEFARKIYEIGCEHGEWNADYYRSVFGSLKGVIPK